MSTAAFSVDQIDSLSERKFDAQAKLNAALAKAQAEFPPIGKSEKADAGSFSYTYAPLDKIIEVAKPVLAKHGLSVTQWLEAGPSVRTEIRHSEGGIISGSFPFPGADAIRTLGGNATYAKRYAYCAALGIHPSDEDDDAAPTRAAEQNGEATVFKAPEQTMISDPQNKKIAVLLKKLEDEAPTQEGQKSWVKQLREEFGVVSRKDLSREAAGRAIEWLEQMLKAQEIPF